MILARTKEDYGIAAVDMFSLGHFLKGYVLNMIFFIYFIPIFTSMLLIFFISVLWEFIENSNYLRGYIKFNKKKDSLVNSVSDVLFAMVGALVFFFVSLTDFFTIIIISLVLSCISLIFFGIRTFSVIKSIIRNNNPQNSSDNRRN
jgi:hypothetical protein